MNRRKIKSDKGYISAWAGAQYTPTAIRWTSVLYAIDQMPGRFVRSWGSPGDTSTGQAP